MMKQLTYLILCSVLLSSSLLANEADEIAELKAKLKNLEAENASLRQQLEAADDEIEQKTKVVTKQEERIEEYEEINRLARIEQRNSSKSATGRDQGPGGSIQLGPFSFGGAIRAQYTDGDYGFPGTDGDVEGPSRDEGTATLDTLYFSGAFEWENLIGAGEYRFYDSVGSFGGYHFLHTLWFGHEFNNGATIKVGVTEVPFGIERFGSGYGFFNQLDNYVGLADDRDLGITYSFSIQDFDIDLGYFLQSEPRGSGESLNSARGSYDVVEPEGDAGALFFQPGGVAIGEGNNFLGGNFSPWEEGQQLNARVKYNFYAGPTENMVGFSAQWGELESTDPLDRFDDGEMWAASVFAKSTYKNWQVKAAITQYKYDIDTLRDQSTFPGTPFFTTFNAYNPDQIVIGGFDTPFYVASEGIIPSIGVSYTHFPRKIDFIDFIVPYIDYSIIIKDGETNGNYFTEPAVPIGTEFQDSEQLSIGAIIGSGNWLVYIDFLFGKGAPLVGNSNAQYFTGASLNDDTGTLPNEFDDSWQHRFNINFGYYY
ncbi:MAG: hypothetical protein AAF546_03320 [Verrucomicrobiota bacterium]